MSEQGKVTDVSASGGVKFDDGKLPTHLIAPEVLIHGLRRNGPHVEALALVAQWWSGGEPSLLLGAAFERLLAALEEAREPKYGYGLEAVTRVLAYGASKYGIPNWERGIAYSRLYGAVLRHVFAVMRGENLDPETGEHHLAHAATEVMFLLAYELRGMGARIDDRPHREVSDA